MKDRRSLERFSLRIPARMKVLMPKKRKLYHITSSNISASGAFFITSKPFMDGTRVNLTLTIPNEVLKKLTGLSTVLNIDGTIVRSDSIGIAIFFDENYEITAMKNL